VSIYKEGERETERDGAVVMGLNAKLGVECDVAGGGADT
jgi:hypothetical protein